MWNLKAMRNWDIRLSCPDSSMMFCTFIWDRIYIYKIKLTVSTNYARCFVYRYFIVIIVHIFLLVPRNWNLKWWDHQIHTNPVSKRSEWTEFVGCKLRTAELLLKYVDSAVTQRVMNLLNLVVSNWMRCYWCMQVRAIRGSNRIVLWD